MRRIFDAMRTMAIVLAMAASAGIALATIEAASAQQRQAPPRTETLRERTNTGIIGLVSGGVEGTYVRIAADLAAVLDTPELRILPILGKGSVQNTLDIMFLRGVDVGIVQSDVLAYLKRERTIPGVERSINYIAKLYNEELHLLGGKDTSTLAALAGKKVNVDSRGSGTFITATLLFEKLGIAVEMTHFDQALALEKLRTGEIAALAYVAGRPTRLFRDVKAEEGLRFIAIPPSDSLLDTYLPATLAASDYPALIGAGESVETIAVGAVMAVYGWPRNSERYQRVAQFVDGFFARFPQLLLSPRHAKWKEVNLAAQLPGWTRFPGAETALAAHTEREGRQRQQFSQFLDQVAPGLVKLTPDQRDALFSQFVEWQRTGTARPAAAQAR